MNKDFFSSFNGLSNPSKEDNFSQLLEYVLFTFSSLQLQRGIAGRGLPT
jgi:hypothetical protein